MIVKPMRLGLITRAQREPPKCFYFVTALGYFDLLDPGDFDLDTNMWPTVATATGGGPLDVGMPKPTGEVVIHGAAMAPGGNPVRRMQVEISVGRVRKTLAVFGDRHWEFGRHAPVFTAPEPFKRMPLVWERAFGGPDSEDNPFGVGHDAAKTLKAVRVAALPNVEDPDDLILNIDHAPKPVGCAPMDVMMPARQRRAGTYDDDWLLKHHPGHAVDFDWAFYNTVPGDQWTPGFLAGDERIRIAGMHAEHPVIRSRLPGMRVRAFVNRARDGAQALEEVPLRCETVVLFPNLLKGVVVYRGGIQVSDIDAKDAVDTMLAYERLGDPEKSREHYARAFAARTDPETKVQAFFDEKPLRPDIPEADLAQRQAERDALAAERDLKWEKRFAFTVAQAYAAAGAVPPPPEALPKPKLPVTIPTITPGDIERMDIDMAAVFDAAARARAFGEAQVAEAKQRAASLLAEVTDIVDGAGGPMMGPADLARLSGAAAGFPAPPKGAPTVLQGDAPSPAALRKSLNPDALSGLDADPFDSLIDALRMTETPSDPLTEAEMAVLRARAEGRPEGRLTAAAMASIDGIDLSEGASGDPTSAPSAVPVAAGVDGFLKELGLADGSYGTADLKQAVDGLGPQGALVIPLMKADPGPKEVDAEGAVENLKTLLVTAGEEIEKAFAEARRLSPEPIAPIEVLRPEASAYLGQVVREILAQDRYVRGCDWAGADLAGTDFSGRDLRGALFDKADLRGARFRGADLEGAVFTGADLSFADLSHCNLKEANLSNVTANRTKFANSDLTNARLLGATLTGADLSHTTIEKVMAVNVDLSHANLTGARLTEVIFVTATFDDASLDTAYCFRTIFLQTSMNGLLARRSTLHRCAIVDCSVRRSDFRMTDLSDTGSIGGTVYDGSVLRDLVAPRSGWHAASMVGVDLRASRLDEADLGGADLTGASLFRTSLRGALLTETVMTGVDATGANFMEAMLRRADLTGACLRRASLYGAGLDDAVLKHCDLTDVNPVGTNLMRALDVAG